MKCAALFFTCLFCLPVQANYGGGSGTAEDPYLIYTAEQINEIGTNANDWTKHFRLMADIDLGAYTGTDFNIIGYWRAFDDRKAFTGVFDGNSKRILHFSYTSADRGYVGIFGYVAGASARIENLGLVGPNVKAGQWDEVGALVGGLEEGIIARCYVKGGSVSGDYAVGGLVGTNWRGSIANCYSTTSVSGSGRDIGGLVGNNLGTIIWCYAAGSVTGAADVGGLVGRGTVGTSAGCFWDIQVSGQTVSAAGIGKSTSEMQSRATFTFAGWDFVGESANGIEDIWTICEGTNYPRFASQIPAGDFACPDGVTMIDFATLGSAWLSKPGDSTWNPAYNISYPSDDVIDLADLAVFADDWLRQQ